MVCHKSDTDVELNLAAAGGKELAHAAAAGDFSKVLDSFDPTLVQINPGALFTKQGGLLHVFTIESQIKQLTSKKDRKKLIESIQSTFLLRAVGETLQPTGTSATDPATGQYVLKIRSKMSVQYALIYRDERRRRKS